MVSLDDAPRDVREELERKIVILTGIGPDGATMFFVGRLSPRTRRWLAEQYIIAKERGE